MSGALVISLDFELHWGLRDHVPMTPQTAATMLTARSVVDGLLERFAAHDVAATWAAVGFLFARGPEDLERHAPAVRPRYRHAALDPFGEPVGADETADPAHYARSLIERIRATPGQEIGTHTYSHHFCFDDQAGLEAFDADLASAVAAASAVGIELRSIVFPRNQICRGSLGVLPRHGIRNFRGNTLLGGPGVLQDAVSQKVFRSLRFADGYLPLSGRKDVPWSSVPTERGLRNVRASTFLRAHGPHDRRLVRWHHRRVLGGMRHAARTGRIFHLWWHPHNFAHEPERCFAVLDTLLAEYDRLKDAYGMRSLTMDGAGDLATDDLAGAPASA